MRMKKWLALALAAVMLLSLCACKSKAAKQTDELILKIGEVTASSGDEVGAAQEAYDALSDKEKEQVENYAVLEQAQADLAAAKREKAISEFDKFVQNNPYASANPDTDYLVGGIDYELLEKYEKKTQELEDLGITVEECPALGYAQLVEEIAEYSKYEDFAAATVFTFLAAMHAQDYEIEAYTYTDASIDVYGDLSYNAYSEATDCIQSAINEIDESVSKVSSDLDVNAYEVSDILDAMDALRDKYTRLLDAFEEVYYGDSFRPLINMLEEGTDTYDACKAFSDEYQEMKGEIEDLLTQLAERHAELYG